MGIWFIIVITGICAFFSFYMAFITYRVGDSGAYLFAAFGILFGIPFVISLIKAAARRSAFVKKLDVKISGEPEPVTFVPHWFMMSALIITGIIVLGVILIPIIVRWMAWWRF